MFFILIFPLVLLLAGRATAAPFSPVPSNQDQPLVARPQLKSYELTFASTCCPVYWEIPLVKLLPTPISTRTTEESLILSIVGNATRRSERKRIEFVHMGERDERLDWEGDEPRAQIETMRIAVPCPIGRAEKVKATHLATLNFYQALSNRSVSVHCGIEGDYLYLGSSA